MKEGTPDRWEWRRSSNGLFTVKTAYAEISKINNNLSNVRESSSRFEGIWTALAPFKAQVTMWRLLWDRLPMKENLLMRNVATHLSPECC